MIAKPVDAAKRSGSISRTVISAAAPIPPDAGVRSETRPGSGSPAPNRNVTSCPRRIAAAAGPEMMSVEGRAPGIRRSAKPPAGAWRDKVQ